MQGRDLWKRRGPRASQSQASWLPTSDGDSALHTHTHTHAHAHAPQPKVCKAKRHPPRKKQPLDGTERECSVLMWYVSRQPRHEARGRSHQCPHQTQVPAAPRVAEKADAFIWLNALRPWGSHSRSQFWSSPSRSPGRPEGQRSGGARFPTLWSRRQRLSPDLMGAPNGRALNCAGPRSASLALSTLAFLLLLGASSHTWVPSAWNSPAPRSPGSHFLANSHLRRNSPLHLKHLCHTLSPSHPQPRDYSNSVEMSA